MKISSFFKKSVIAGLVVIVFAGPSVASAALYGAANLSGQIEAGVPYYTSGLPDDSANPRGFNAGTDTVIDTAGNRAFVVDSTNNRVLVFNLTAGGAFVDRVADFVLGQADFKTIGAGTSQNQLNTGYSYGLAFDAAGQRLFVSDAYNNRVLVFDVTTIVNGENAVNVLGQPDFVSSGASATLSGFNFPAGLAYNAATQRLFVADQSNARVLVFDVAAITDGEPAVNVLGREPGSNWTTSFDTTEANIASFTFDSTNGVLYAGSSPSGIIYRCATSTACDAAGDWTVSYDTTDNAIVSLLFDATNGVLYAGNGFTGGPTGNGAIYRCATATGCDAATDWTVSFDTAENQITTLTRDTVNGILYAGSLGSGTIYRCATSSACDADTDWTVSYDTTSTDIRALTFDSANGVLYATTAASIPNGKIYRCVATTSCDAASDWTVAATIPFSTVNTLAFDSTNGVLYGGTQTDYSGTMYRCVTTTGCDATSDWTTSVGAYGAAFISTEFDPVSGAIYAGTQGGVLSRCATSSNCDAPGDWTTSLDTRPASFYGFFFDLGIDTTNNVIYVGTGSDGIIYRCPSGCAPVAPPVFMTSPTDVAYDTTNNRLFVSDVSSNRVLVYDVAAITDGENPINVLGQGDFVSTTPATTQNGFFQPGGLAYDTTGSRLFVSDSSNNRVMVFSVAAITNGENAVNVLGQANFTSGAPGVTQNTVSYPAGLGFDLPRQKLYVAEPNSNRVTVFDVTAIVNGENAVDILGQTNPNDTPHYTNFWINNSPGDIGFNGATAVALDAVNHRLFVADRTNARVLVFNLTVANALTSYNADFVLGQASFKIQTSGAGPSQNTLASADGLVYNSATQRLFVSDAYNNRIMVYDVTAITNGENAVNVLGQPNFTSNAGATTQAGLSLPTGLAYRTAANELMVADTYNNRVIVYNVAAITNGENATDVLGQPDFVSNAPAVSQSGMDGPTAVVMNGANSRLYVADANNNRVLSFDTTGGGNGITNGENAVNVLGQANFTSNGAATTQAGLSNPRGLAYDTTRNRLDVSDAYNNRIIVYDVAAITNGENAVDVFGQLDYVSGGSGVTPSRMNIPMGLAYDAGLDYLIAADSMNHRVMFFNLGAPVISPFSAIFIGDPSAAPLAFSADPGDTITYDLSLAQAPTAPVVVTLNEVDPDNVVRVKDRITFTKKNWMDAKKITVKARKKAKKLPGAETVTVQHIVSSTDPAFNGIAIPDVSVVVNE